MFSSQLQGGWFFFLLLLGSAFNQSALKLLLQKRDNGPATVEAMRFRTHTSTRRHTNTCTRTNTHSHPSPPHTHKQPSIQNYMAPVLLLNADIEETEESVHPTGRSSSSGWITFILVSAKMINAEICSLTFKFSDEYKCNFFFREFKFVGPCEKVSDFTSNSFHSAPFPKAYYSLRLY